MSDQAFQGNYIELTSDIVSAFVSNNTVPTTELASLIGLVHSALLRANNGAAPVEGPEKPVPAVPIRKSITPEAIICLEDGKRFKSMKRHLSSHHNMTPEEYRARWGLPADYPMVAPNYASARSELAKAAGLGQQRKKAAPKGRKSSKGQ